MSEATPSEITLEIEVYDESVPATKGRHRSFTAEGGADVSDHIVRRFERLSEQHFVAVNAAILRIQDSLKTAVENVDEFEVTFGLKFGGANDLKIVSTSLEATVGIKLVWKRPASPSPNPGER